MADKVTAIPRSQNLMTREEFMRLKTIHDNNPWLAYENVNGLYELWEFADNDVQKELLEFLIDNFSYVGSDKFREACKSIAYQIESEWELSPQNTIITAICDNSEPDGSQFLLQAIKNKLFGGWKDALYNAITTAAHNASSNSNFVIIDDFIGTGDKVTRKIKYVYDTFTKIGVKDVKVYVCSLAAMSFSKQVIESSTESMYSYMYLSKGISELAPEDKRDIYFSAMISLEDYLHWSKKQNKRFSLGYMKSEALFSLESTNVPNNVFPIFWWRYVKPGVERLPLLRRL